MHQSLRARTWNLLRNYNLHLKKRWGQNFLVSEKILQEIVDFSQLTSEDVVVEIGAGIGTLTKELLRVAKKVIAVEKDKRLVGILKDVLKDFKNVKIVQDDILKIKAIKELGVEDKNYKVVANLPFAVATRVIMGFLELENPPKLMIVMVQKEVGKRICARPPKMSKLSVFCQFHSKVNFLDSVPKRNFFPSPKVDSAILKIVPCKHTKPYFINLFSKPFYRRFSQVVKAGFSHPRKQLANNLSEAFNLPKEKAKKLIFENKISAKARAGNLTVADWVKLTKSLFLKI